MNVVIIGNGILALSAAYSILKKDSSTTIKIVGPQNKEGCASLAAAAMFNSYCELEPGTLENKFEKEKWLLNQSANHIWPDLLKRIEEESNKKINYGFGTFLINNQTADFIEDENFDAIINGLNNFNEPYQTTSSQDIPFYNPSAQGRAGRAIYIQNEGWVNPFDLINAFETILIKSNRVHFIFNKCQKLNREGEIISNIFLENGELISGDSFLLASGATFSSIIDASNLGITLPRIFYGVGSTIILQTEKNTLTNCIRTPNRGLACGTYAAPQESDKTVVGASNNILPWPENNSRVTSIYTLLKNAMEQINKDYFKSQLLKISTGWRPTSEDTLPLIGGTSLKNLFITTGTKRDGFHSSPVISDYISDLILNKKSNHSYHIFNPERNPVRVYTRQESINKFIKHSIDAHFQHDFIPSKDSMLDSLKNYYRNEAEILHDKVGAHDWGIPVELYNMYKYNHAH